MRNDKRISRLECDLDSLKESFWALRNALSIKVSGGPEQWIDITVCLEGIIKYLDLEISKTTPEITIKKRV